jgi:hypothetical protein
VQDKELEEEFFLYLGTLLTAGGRESRSVWATDMVMDAVIHFKRTHAGVQQLLYSLPEGVATHGFKAMKEKEV